MNPSLYNPFKNFDFKNTACFLTGKADEELAATNVIPQWLLNMAKLSGNEQIKLLDESVRSYDSLKIPCAKSVLNLVVSPLEEKVALAFAKGHDGVKDLAERDLFHWIGKMMYGFLYIEMQGAIRLKQLSTDGMNMSQGLMHKFGNLHLMLQGLFRPVEFEGFSPWSITVVPLESAQTAFSFRDEINTLTFSMKFKDFGLIACLQDNGTNKRYHHQILAHIEGKSLSEQQFEELCARFYYSAYLFSRLPEYTVLEAHNVVYIDAMPLRGMQNKPLFDEWQHKTYAQVLENFWKPWGHSLFEIIKNPQQPLSYFENPLLPNM